MVHKLFWINPYQTSLLTQVCSVDDDQIRLKETIFYAMSGGQESDRGTIGGYDVIKAERRNLDIVYSIDPNHSLRPEEYVEVKIDWVRRYRLMRLHLAAEIVLELIYRSMPDIEKIGAHISEDKARIDFRWPDSLVSCLESISGEANRIIQQNQEVISAYSDETLQRRYWQIAGFAKVPCGGTHLRYTEEIGAIYLKRKNPGKSKERIEIYLFD